MRKDSITIATLPATAKAPMRLERLPNDLPKLKKWLDRVAREGELQACQHDKRDAADLARLYRAGELVPVRIPREADERVRDVVRCRETFQREILTSRHHIVTFLATRGVVFREGTNWCTPHLQWLQHLTTDASPLAAEDRLVSREYRALLMYKLQRREEPLGLDSGGMTAQPDRPDSGSRGERSSQGGSCPHCAPGRRDDSSGCATTARAMHHGANEWDSSCTRARRPGRPCQPFHVARGLTSCSGAATAIRPSDGRPCGALTSRQLWPHAPHSPRGTG